MVFLVPHRCGPCVHDGAVAVAGHLLVIGRSRAHPAAWAGWVGGQSLSANGRTRASDAASDVRVTVTVTSPAGTSATRVANDW